LARRDTNRRFKEIIAAGGEGLSTAFDMPTLLGLDSDDPMALGEVGRCGVAIDTWPTCATSSPASTWPPSPRR
jgi:methylmalonyl-CoA mutase N-terminal domain/subunit